ncbi:unnamed protein product [Urochloa humidicola]
MAPRSRLLDLETHDVLIFYGGDDRASVATHSIVFWPVFLAAVALLLHLAAPFTHAAAATCAGLYGAYCFLLDHAARRRSRCSSAFRRAPAPSHTSGTRHVMARLYD